MADRFLREVERMHQLRRDINEMTPEEADELIRGLDDDAAEDWVFAARDAQLPPPDLSWCWLFLGGRGAGKSHSMSAAVHTAVRVGIKRIHFIAPTTTDFHDVNVRPVICEICSPDCDMHSGVWHNKAKCRTTLSYVRPHNLPPAS